MTNFDSFLKKMTGETDEPKKRVEKNLAPRSIKRESVRETQSEEIQESVEEDIIERAFDYASTFSKIVKKNFSNKNDRRIVLEAVRSAINLSLGESISDTRVSESVVKGPTNAIIETTETQQEDPYDIIRAAQTSRLPENFNQNSNVEGDLNIKAVQNANGDSEIDLSDMTNEDIYAMRVISGIETHKSRETQLNENKL